MKTYTKYLLALLLISLGVRIWLVIAGGQFFWPDEERYFLSRLAADHLLAGNFKGTLFYLHNADHFLFKVIGVLPALAESLWGLNDKIPSAFFSLFSVVNIWLVGKLARRLGARDRQALVASLLLAFSTTFLFYARHMLPYDLAMSFGLAAIWAALRRPVRTRDSILTGLLALATFLSYNGYWVLVGFALLAHLFWKREPSMKGSLKQAALFGIAFAAPLAILLALSEIYAPEPLLQQFLTFSGTITHGVFYEGWSLPFAFLWYAEHLLFVFWLAVAGYWGWRFFAGERNPQLAFGLAGIAFVYGNLVLFSVVLQKFVVYGRLARQVVPFMCLLGAMALERLWTSGKRGRAGALAVVGLLAVQAGINFYPVMVQDFPAEFRLEVREVRLPLEPGEFEFINVHFIHPFTMAEAPQDRLFELVLSKPHPLEYLPFQYQGYTPEKRAYLRDADIRMKFVIYDD